MSDLIANDLAEVEGLRKKAERLAVLRERPGLKAGELYEAAGLYRALGNERLARKCEALATRIYEDDQQRRAPTETDYQQLAFVVVVGFLIWVVGKFLGAW